MPAYSYLYFWEQKTFIIVDKPEFILGRVEGNFVNSKDPALSRKHCAFRTDASETTITDLGSQNGVWINGQRIRPNQPMRLNEGDWIQVGRMRLFFTFTQTIPDVTSTGMVPNILGGDVSPSVSKTISEKPVQLDTSRRSSSRRKP